MNKYFTEKTDDTDIIFAEDFNNAFDYIETDMNARQKTIEKNVANGYAGLDSTGKIHKEQMPETTAADVPYTGTESGLSALNVQSALDELAEDKIGAAEYEQGKIESDNRYLPQDTAAGTVPQTEYAIAANAKNYQVYGNSVQDGTPAPDSPVAVQSVGDLVTSGEYAGKYAITETITNGDTTETITVYLDEPLRKLGNYADYIDYEQQKVIRNIVKIRLTGPFEYYNSTTWQFNTGSIILKTGKELCSHFQNNQSGSQFGINNKNATGYFVCVRQVEANMGLTLDEFNTWLTENEVYYYAVLATPTEEPLTLAPMPLGAGTNNITTGTAIQPSNVIVDYYQNPTDVINSLKTAIVAMQSQTE